MMNGIWFDEYHSYDDLNLVLSEVYIPPAEPKTNYVDIPGGDGSVDLTEALGEVRYKDREGEITFTAFPTDDFEVKKKEVSNLLNGKRFKIRLDKDPDYYWDGRCVVSEYDSDKNVHKIVVNATVRPYKLKTNLTTVIVSAGDGVNETLQNARKTVIPTITTTAVAKIVFNGNTYNLNAGIHRILNVELVEGANTVTVTSDADVVFTYQEGDL